MEINKNVLGGVGVRCLTHENITLASIATEDATTPPVTTYTLIADITIITECQILNIPEESEFIIPAGKTLINNGTININYAGELTVNGTMNNSGTMNLRDQVANFSSAEGGEINNSGTIKMTGPNTRISTVDENSTFISTGIIYLTNEGTISNITNNGIINRGNANCGGPGFNILNTAGIIRNNVCPP